MKTYYDADDLEVAEGDAGITKVIFTLKLQLRIDGFSFDSAQVANIDSASVVTVTPPSLGIQSTAPLGGRFVIKCPDPRD